MSTVYDMKVTLPFTLHGRRVECRYCAAQVKAPKGESWIEYSLIDGTFRLEFLSRGERRLLVLHTCRVPA